MILIRHGQSEFNAIYGPTRRDPGIPDPRLTPTGRRQAEAAASALLGRGIRRLISSPYTRALETAAIIAATIDVSVSIEPLVRERFAFSCDIGQHPHHLARRWPELDFAALALSWWSKGEEEESEAALGLRAQRFRRQHADTPDWQHVAVVTHWGFIRALTGREPTNGELVPFDPTRD